MSDRRPERLYGILVRDGRVFMRLDGGRLALPGGPFPPLAEDRKAELSGHISEQLGVTVRTLWAQGAFAYAEPGAGPEAFSGFYTAWDWEGEPPAGGGAWLDAEQVQWAPGIAPSLRILLLSVLDTKAVRTR